MANEQNLRPFTSDQSREEAQKNGRKGGKASGKKKQERKTFREGLLLLLNEPVLKDGKPSDKTTQDVVIAALVKRAISGDTRAFEMIRDTIGEKPAQDVNVSTGNFDALDAAFKGMRK